jgi:hypothetical protein
MISDPERYLLLVFDRSENFSIEQAVPVGASLARESGRQLELQEK